MDHTLKFTSKFILLFYMMGKALSGKQYCMGTGFVCSVSAVET